MRVVVTRETGYNADARAWLGADVEVSEVPLTTTRYVDPEAVSEQLDRRGADFRTLVVSSARAARFVSVVARALGPDAEVLSVGSATTRALRDVGVSVAGEASSRALDLAERVGDGPVLLLGARGMRDELAEALSDRGVVVSRIVCYETVPVVLTDAQASALSSADAVMIGAPSSWAVARDHVTDTAWVVVPGPTTAAAVRVDHDRVIEEWGPSLRGVLDTLAREGPSGAVIG